MSMINYLAGWGVLGIISGDPAMKPFHQQGRMYFSKLSVGYFKVIFKMVENRGKILDKIL